MKKKSTSKRMRYWFDRILIRGPIVMSLLLFSVMFFIVIVIGLLAFLLSDDGNLAYQIWVSFMHTLDAGTLSGNDTDNIPYLVLMTLSTLCGLFVTSVLIGIIATGVESRLQALRKGTSVIHERNHTLIIGFDENIYVLLRELILANENKKKACIVVLGTQPKEDMEEAIYSHISNTQTTRIICRSGSLHESYSFERCALQNAHSVILNSQDDAETVKILLALSTYLAATPPLNDHLHFITSLHDAKYSEVVKIASKNRAVSISVRNTIARIIANTCRQRGLSHVLTEFFNFAGNEPYFEAIPSLQGKTFLEVSLSISNAIPLGIYANGKVTLNPPPDTILHTNDQLILLEQDDNDFTIHETKKGNATQINSTAHLSSEAANHLVVLGSNDKLPIILTEYNKYVAPGTRVTIVDDDFCLDKQSTYSNLDMQIYTEPVTQELLYQLLSNGTRNVLLLNDDSTDPETSDSETLLRLILIRDIADSYNLDFAITTEMRSVENQRLASQARVDDFVIGLN